MRRSMVYLLIQRVGISMKCDGIWSLVSLADSVLHDNGWVLT